MKNVKVDLTSEELDYFLFVATAVASEMEGKEGEDLLEEFELDQKETFLPTEKLAQYIFDNIKKGNKMYWDCCEGVFIINDNNKIEYIGDTNFQSLLGSFIYYKDENYLIKQVYNKIKILKKYIKNDYFTKILSSFEKNVKERKIDLNKEEENLTSCFSEMCVASTKTLTDEKLAKLDNCCKLFTIKDDKKSFKLLKKLIDNKTIFYYDFLAEEIFYFDKNNQLFQVEVDDDYYNIIFGSLKQEISINLYD